MQFVFKILLTSLLALTAGVSLGAECTLYEKAHPAFLLDGSHLSTGKCQSCASCHKNGVFTGTPKTCVACHNGDPRWSTVARSAKHIPTLMVDCSNCHKTVTFTLAAMNHAAVTTLRCDSCHNGLFKSYGAAGKPKDHPKTTADCGTCHTTRTFSK